MLMRYHRPGRHYVIVIVVVIIILTILTLSVAGNGNGNACSSDIGTYLEAAYNCQPDEFHEKVDCKSERLRLVCPKAKYLIIHSAQIQPSPTNSSLCSSPLTHSPTDDDDTPHAACSAVCVRQLFINLCQGRRRCLVDTAEKRFQDVSGESCHLPAHAKPKRVTNVIYTCVLKSVLRAVFSNSSHHSPPIAPDPCLSVAMETPSSPFHAGFSSVTRQPSLRPRPSSSWSPEVSAVAMVTPVAGVAAAAVGRDDHGEATDRLSEEVDLSIELVSLVVTSESVQTSQSETDETDTVGHGLEYSLATIVMTTEDAMTTTTTTSKLKWSTLWYNHLSSDWAWSYHFISENKEKFFLYLALAISLGFIFILFAIVLRLSFRKPLASHPTDSPTHRCRCSGSLSPKADPGGSSARQPLTMSCTSPITWRLPDIDPSIAGDERPGRGCEVQLTSFNRLNSLPRLRRDSIVDVPPPPSPVSSTVDHVNEEVLSPDVPAVSSHPETMVNTTATISRSHLNFIDNHSFVQAPPTRPLSNVVSRPVTTVVTMPLTTDEAGGETCTAFTKACEGNGTAVGCNTSSSNQFYLPDQMDSSLAARVSVRPMAKFGSFGRNPGGSPCGQEYRELRQFSKTLQLPPGNHYFCT